MDEKTRKLREFLESRGPDYGALVARKKRRRAWFYALLLAAIAAYLLSRLPG